MKGVFGGILMAVGILIAGGSGLCSLMILFGGSGEFSGFEMWPMVLMIGGIPFAVGAGIAYGGYALLRSARRERNDNPESTDQHAQ
jgi:hypothetical protein